MILHARRPAILTRAVPMREHYMKQCVLHDYSWRGRVHAQCVHELHCSLGNEMAMMHSMARLGTFKL